MRSVAPPLCPAGHLPHKGGDWLEAAVSPNNERCELRNVSGVRSSGHLSISPLVGEMSGRTEGGNVNLRAWRQAA